MRVEDHRRNVHLAPAERRHGGGEGVVGRCRDHHQSRRVGQAVGCPCEQGRGRHATIRLDARQDLQHLVFEVQTFGDYTIGSGL